MGKEKLEIWYIDTVSVRIDSKKKMHLDYTLRDKKGKIHKLGIKTAQKIFGDKNWSRMLLEMPGILVVKVD